MKANGGLSPLSPLVRSSNTHNTHNTHTHTHTHNLLTSNRFRAHNFRIIDPLVKLVEYLSLDLFFSGGSFFYFFERLYIWRFESSHRHKTDEKGLLISADKKWLAKNSLCSKKLLDYENCSVVGRNRRPSHSTLRSFGSNKDDSLKYWMADKTYEQKQRSLTNKFYLSGLCGCPDLANTWKFLLCGCPEDAPQEWFAVSYDCDSSKAEAELVGEGEGLSAGRWSDVALPAHWQLQGFDIPIYTNTTYPFPLDPPRARRNGNSAQLFFPSIFFLLLLLLL